MKTLLSGVLRRYRVVAEEKTLRNINMRVKLNLIMKPVNGFQVILQRRVPKIPYRNADGV